MDERELCIKMIRGVLDHEGIKLNTEFEVLNYLLSCDEEYTIYDSFEGGMLLIAKKLDGTEIRYRVLFDEDDNVSTERM